MLKEQHWVNGKIVFLIHLLNDCYLIVSFLSSCHSINNTMKILADKQNLGSFYVEIGNSLCALEFLSLKIFTQKNME